MTSASQNLKSQSTTHVEALLSHGLSLEQIASAISFKKEMIGKDDFYTAYRTVTPATMEQWSQGQVAKQALTTHYERLALLHEAVEVLRHGGCADEDLWPQLELARGDTTWLDLVRKNSREELLQQVLDKNHSNTYNE